MVDLVNVSNVIKNSQHLKMKHKRIDHGGLQYNCDTCHKESKTNNLEKHKQTARLQYKCNKCYKELIKTDELEKHKRTDREYLQY